MSKTLKSTGVAALAVIALGLSSVTASAGDASGMRQSATVAVSDATEQADVSAKSFRGFQEEAREAYPSGREGR